MKYDISTQSHKGLVRANNEDMILVDNRFIRDETYEIQQQLDESGSNLLLALADGMGGHNGGEVASEETLQRLSTFFDSLPRGLSADELKQAFQTWAIDVHKHLQQMGSEHPNLLNMGTTLVGLCIYEGRVYRFHAGDSRLYRMRGDELTRLTEDHTYDRMTGLPKHAHILTNCVGCGHAVFLDFQCIPDTPLPEETFLLCSDGLTDLVSDEQLSRFLKAGSTAQPLIRQALYMGGKDNVSVCVIRFS